MFGDVERVITGLHNSVMMLDQSIQRLIGKVNALTEVMGEVKAENEALAEALANHLQVMRKED